MRNTMSVDVNTINAIDEIVQANQKLAIYVAKSYPTYFIKTMNGLMSIYKFYSVMLNSNFNGNSIQNNDAFIKSI